MSTSNRGTLTDLVKVARSDPKAELEVKILSGQIRTKDEADRIVRAIERLGGIGPMDEHRASFTYPDGLRVNVMTPEVIFKLCTSGSFRGLPLTVERKGRYLDVCKPVIPIANDVLDLPDVKLRVTCRHEEQLRKDFSGAPMDPKNHVRVLHRKSWKTPDGLLRIDFSMVKSKTKATKSLSDILKQPAGYELEVEVINKEADPETVVKSLLAHAEILLAAYQQSSFLLTDSDLQRYRMEFDATKTRFINPVTLIRRHIVADRQSNILRGYTVTNKADGERCMLFVARDRRVLRVTRKGTIVWTGLTANDDSHLGDIVDGEYLVDRNLFCIFDVYVFRTKRVDRLPLLTTDEDIVKEPLRSRLGCAHLLVADLKSGFTTGVASVPFRVETKLFLAGDGRAMETAINRILDTKFEYPTDGLIFTPRDSPVAPISERKGDTWVSLYKWKPPHQNSIDFLVRYTPSQSYDPILKKQVFKGTLYVSRNPGSDILYPCETMTGEYTPPQLPADLQRYTDRVPSPFQPAAPRSPSASEILLQLNATGIPVDETGQKVEDNTIIECVRDVSTGRWNVMRTRYDKTYQYRVLNQPQFGNDIATADSIWANIHNPVTEEMLRVVVSSPADDTYEDDLYYRDALESRDRVMADIMGFHNKIKESLYMTYVKPGHTLLELASGRGNDMHKWKKTKPSKVVGIELSDSNINAPRQGACVRYLKMQTDTPKEPLPPALFVVGDMTQPLRDQQSHYLKILRKEEPAPTPYLEKFAGLNEFDVISCQFAMHYACETEESFRRFVGNLTEHGKGIFFGTCLDGQAVYSLLLGTSGRVFRSGGSSAAPRSQVWGEIQKEYADGDGWTEEFGKSITVKLESFERPVKEYLVPFGKVMEILTENGYELVRTTMFADHYNNQTTFTFEEEHKDFSFLHRSFAFKRVAVRVKIEEVQEVDVPVVGEEGKESEPEGAKKEEEKKTEPEAAKKDEEKKTEPEAAKEKKPRKKIAKKEPEPGQEPVLFFAGNETLNEFKEFSNSHEAPMQVDGVTFPTVDHYVEWSKAKQFGDGDAEKKIMKTKSSKSVIAYGKKVVNFDEAAWAEKSEGIMRTALKAKFMQHPELRAKLVGTKERPIGEADPRDKEWSIGTGADTAKAKNPEKWPGKNKLGKLLMELRTELKE